MTTFLTLRDRLKLYFKILDNKASKYLILSHGLCEHSGRHEYLQKLFPDFNLVFYDLRGHGRSGGPRSFVDEFSEFTDDLEELLVYLCKTYEMQDYSLIGFSMGSIIVSDFIQRKSQKVFAPSNVFLTSVPIVRFKFNFKGLLPLLNCLPFPLRVGRPFDEYVLSHDRRVLKEYREDPLSQRRISFNLLVNISDATERIFSQDLNSPCPLFVALGSEDKVLSRSAVEHFFSLFEKKATLKVFQGAYHELHHELDIYSAPYFKFLKRSLSGGCE